MILTCPACQTRYLVPDASVGPAGRQVRCAACRHSWFQEPPLLDLATAAEAPSPEPELEPEPTAAAPLVEPVAEPEPVLVAPPPEPAFEPEPEPIVYADDEPEIVRRFDAGPPPPRPRRNRARPWTWIAVIAAVLMLAALGALYAWGPDGLRARFAARPAAEVPLRIVLTGNERRATASGNELLSVAGRIVNPTQRVQPVPDIRVDLLDAQERVVFGWTIVRPVPQLAPGAAAEFDGAVLDVPKAARDIDLSFARPTTG